MLGAKLMIQIVEQQKEIGKLMDEVELFRCEKAVLEADVERLNKALADEREWRKLDAAMIEKEAAEVKRLKRDLDIALDLADKAGATTMVCGIAMKISSFIRLRNAKCEGAANDQG